MDFIGRVLRGAFDKSKHVAGVIAILMGMWMFYLYDNHGDTTWCPTLTYHIVQVGETWESLAARRSLPVRTLKMCNMEFPGKNTRILEPDQGIWLPRPSVMAVFIVLVWVALQSFTMPAVVSVVLLYVLLMVFIFGITFSLCPGTTHTLTLGDSIWAGTGGRVWGVLVCNLRLIGQDLSLLPVGLQFRVPNSAWAGGVVVLIAIATWKLFAKED